ncbi:MAG: tripartite tricarboxylate transporter substrate-binding protein, partial [Bradyrhizobium guangdongense]
APNLPTVGETLPGFDTSLWFGFVAPAGTPKPVIDKLSGAINEALKNEEVAKPLRAAGLDIKGGTPDQFAAIIASETKQWDRVIAAAGLRK